MGGGVGKGQISKKGKMKKYDVFSGIKVIKISFSVIFNEEIRVRGLCPLTPAGGAAPWTPEVPSPPLKIYPGTAPGFKEYMCYKMISFGKDFIFEIQKK